MPRQQATDDFKKYIWGFLACAAVVAMLRDSGSFQSGHGWIGLGLAAGGWFFVLLAAHRQALTDRRPPRPIEGDPKRLAVPTLIAGVFWAFGWFFGVLAVLFWWGVENKRRKESAERPWYAPLVDGVLESSPEMKARLSTPMAVSVSLGGMPRLEASATVTVVDFAVFSQTLLGEDRKTFERMTERDGFLAVLEGICRQALEKPFEAEETDPEAIAELWRQALELEGLKAESIEVRLEGAPSRPAPVVALESPEALSAAAEAVVPAAPVPEPISSPVADLFARPEPEPFGAFSTSSTSASGFSSATEGFEEVLAKLQGRPSPDRQA